MVIGSLTTNIVADLSKWGPNLTKARGQMAGFVQSVNVMQGVMAGLVTGAVASFIKSGADLGSSIHDVSQGLKVGAENLQVFRHAAEQSGSTAATLDRSLAFLSKTVGKGSAAFARLGLDVEKLRSQQIDQTFLDVIDAIRRLPTESERAAAAQQLLGKSSSSLNNVIHDGASALRELRGEMEKYNMVVSQNTVELTDSLGDRVGALQKRWDNLKIRVAASAESIIRVAEHVNENPMLLFGDPLRQARTPWWLRKQEMPASFPRTPAMQEYSNTRNPGGSEYNIQGIGVSMLSGVNLVLQGIQDTINTADQHQTKLNNIISKLPVFMQVAIAEARGQSLPGPVESVFRKAGEMVGAFSNATASPSPEMSAIPRTTLRLARTGTAESYRQRAATQQQNDQSKIAKKHLKEAEKQTGILGKVANALVNGAGMPANLFGN